MCVHKLRSSHWRCSKKKDFLKNFAKFTEKQASGLRAATLLKKILQHWCFLINFANFFRIPILQNDPGTTASVCYVGDFTQLKVIPTIAEECKIFSLNRA